MPSIEISTIGYGAGQTDFEHPNILRLIIGETQDAAPTSVAAGTDTIVLLETNLDDMPGEIVGYCAEQLWNAGALDVATSALQMKKGRPGILLSVQCRPEDADQISQIIFRETTTLGLRRSTLERVTLPRKSESVSTEWGDLEGMVADLPDGTQRFSPEFASCQEIADKQKVPLMQVYTAARQAWNSKAKS